MKTVIVIGLMVLGFVACKRQTSSAPAADESPKIEMQTDTTAKEYTSKYICPMYCKGSGSDNPGVCPACGMDYELRESM